MNRNATSRLISHLATDQLAVRRRFDGAALARIEQAIAQGERTHRGQVQVAIEAALPVQRVWKRATPHERALEVFSSLRVWDTEENVGVLIYLLLADRAVEIVADRGIDRVVGKDAWQSICADMQRGLREGRYADAVVDGIDTVSRLLAKHFPGSGGRGNELPDKPVVID
jgi:uncharacterized membrane protein